MILYKNKLSIIRRQIEWKGKYSDIFHSLCPVSLYEPCILKNWLLRKWICFPYNTPLHMQMTKNFCICCFQEHFSSYVTIFPSRDLEWPGNVKHIFKPVMSEYKLSSWSEVRDDRRTQFCPFFSVLLLSDRIGYTVKQCDLKILLSHMWNHQKVTESGATSIICNF